MSTLTIEHNRDLLLSSEPPRIPICKNGLRDKVCKTFQRFFEYPGYWTRNIPIMSIFMKPVKLNKSCWSVQGVKSDGEVTLKRVKPVDLVRSGVKRTRVVPIRLIRE